MIFAGKLFMLWHEILLFAITNQVSSKSHSDVAAACVEKNAVTVSFNKEVLKG